MMPIQRQSDAYDGLNGDGLRFAREYTTRDLPEGLVNALSKGVGITAGLNDPRGMARQADAYQTARPSPAPVPDSYWADDEAAHDQYFHNQEHGLDREPPHDDGAFREEPHPQVEPLDHMLEGYQIPTPEVPADYHEQFGPHMASFTEAHASKGGPAPIRTAAPAISSGTVPAAAPVYNHGYVPGHRISLPWRDQAIPGTVTHLDGQQVGVRWDDGQHSTEEPADLRPL